MAHLELPICAFYGNACELRQIELSAIIALCGETFVQRGRPGLVRLYHSSGDGYEVAWPSLPPIEKHVSLRVPSLCDSCCGVWCHGKACCTARWHARKAFESTSDAGISKRFFL